MALPDWPAAMGKALAAADLLTEAEAAERLRLCASVASPAAGGVA